MLRRVFVLGLCAALSGCIIGTWPQPEMRADRGNGKTPLSPETCDGVDNDADGSVDEGCKCTGEVRGCVAASGTQCGYGVQHCTKSGWTECGDFRGPFVAAVEPSIALTSTPSALVRDGSGVHASVVATAACPGIRVAEVQVTLSASAPSMSVSRHVADTGGASFETDLGNPFGPGVPAQDLVLKASAAIGGRAVEAQVTVRFEEAP